jgi:hypothetical protein
MNCKLTRYKTPNKDGIVKFVYDQRFRDMEITYKLNLLLRDEECQCEICNPNTSSINFNNTTT